jgi:REP element-mobilizing transposase RayT
MPDQPLAYFITFTSYGTWLHGDSPGAVDRDHNIPGTPFLPPEPERRAASRDRMTQEPYVLDAARRTVVRDAIVEACQFRGWRIHALHVRTNHVHLVVTAEREPEFVMKTCKSRASRWLNEAGFDHPERKRWTDHGSTKYKWDEEGVAAVTHYTLYRQGEPMAVYPEITPRFRSGSEANDSRPSTSGSE